MPRRDALQRLGVAGAGALLGSALPAVALNQASETPIRLAGHEAELVITPVSAATLRISLLPIENGRAIAVQESLVFADNQWPEPTARIRSIIQHQTVAWQQRRIQVSGDSSALKLMIEETKPAQTLVVDLETGAVHFAREGRIFGLGEGGPQFDRSGQSYPMKNGESVPDLAVNGARLPIPCLISTAGWALFFHLPLGRFDLSAAEAKVEPLNSESPLPLDLFLVMSDNPPDIMKEYAKLTGFPHLPPRWALGYQQSHRTLASREEVLDEAKTFREKKLPCDALIYLGTGFCPSGWNTGHGSFTFNSNVFPDPGPMIQQLGQENFKVVLHVVNPPMGLHGRASDTGSAADDETDAARYWQKHLGVFRLGVAGWWPDEGDALGPIECLVRNRMYWEGPQLERPNERPYALNRNGYAGLQRYGWLWSGDIDSTWEVLRAQIAVGINTGLSGIPLWGTDTGGFVTTPELTGELYARWFQFSAFCPLFRSHGRTWKLRLPWQWNTGDYGPTELNSYHGKAGLPDPKELHNPEIEPICRKYLELRWRLMPYTYSVVRESHDTGLPIMRALWLHYPNDSRAVEHSDEYLWGRDILVAPVTEGGATKREVYLPPGLWRDFWTEKEVEGGRTISREVDLATLPLYVRAGAVVPTGPVQQYSGEVRDEPMQFTIYPGADGEFELYEDDGVSFEYEHGHFTRLRAQWNNSHRQLTLSSLEGLRPSEPRPFNFRVAGESQTKQFGFDGTTLTVRL
ncbi:MAG TPA: TIM-barrel domain-containing protein [Terriglobia bacterium]|nr:TIM-barrel domain-containing protein [Terriglobia bacterium]